MSERKCGTCSLCCKLFPVAQLEKPLGQWCQYCKPGCVSGGCGIYATRPQICRDYVCGWLGGDLADHWAPERCRMVTWYYNPDEVSALAGALAGVIVDEGTDYYRRSPWVDEIRDWVLAGDGGDTYQPFIITIMRSGERPGHYLVLPNDPIELFPVLQYGNGEHQRLGARVAFPVVFVESGRWYASYDLRKMPGVRKVPKGATPIKINRIAESSAEAFIWITPQKERIT